MKKEKQSTRVHFACPQSILDSLNVINPDRFQAAQINKDFRNDQIRLSLERFRGEHAKGSRVNVFKPLYEIERFKTTPRPRLRRPPAPTVYIIGNIEGLPDLQTEPRKHNERIMEYMSGLTQTKAKKTIFKIARHEKGLGPIVSLTLSPELIDWLPQTSRERSEFIRFILQQPAP